MERSTRTIYLMWQATAKIHNLIDHASSGSDVSLLRYVVLSFVHGHQDITSAELARRIGVSPQAMNQTVSAMEQAGLLRKKRQKTNLKSLPLELTEDGLATLARAEKTVDQVEALVLASLGKKEVATLRKWMSAIILSAKASAGQNLVSAKVEL